MASLDYSLQQLSENQRTLLHRLAPFEGGANEDNLLAITEIPEDEWVTLRGALEQAALLSIEQIHKEITVPFLHFHPVLIPYLRGQLGPIDDALHERYGRRYFTQAYHLASEDRRHPQSVHAQVRGELPNLLRALNLVLGSGKLEKATDMAENIDKFVIYFGLGKEHEELHKVIETIVATMQESEILTKTEFRCERFLSLEAFHEGRMQAAIARFTRAYRGPTCRHRGRSWFIL